MSLGPSAEHEIALTLSHRNGRGNFWIRFALARFAGEGRGEGFVFPRHCISQEYTRGTKKEIFAARDAA